MLCTINIFFDKLSKNVIKNIINLILKKGKFLILWKDGFKLGSNPIQNPEEERFSREPGSFLWRSAKKLFSSNEAKSPPSNQSSSPDYDSILEVKSSLSGGVVGSYLKMFESFLHDRKKEATGTCNENFLLGGRQNETKNTETQTNSEKRSEEEQRNVKTGQAAATTGMNTSGLLSVNINMDEAELDVVAASSTSSSTAPATSSPVPSSSANCTQRSFNSTQISPNKIEEPKIVRRQQKYVVQLR